VAESHGINVNGVAPTFVNSEMAQHVLKDPVASAKLFERIPLGRIAEPEDVVGPPCSSAAPAPSSSAAKSSTSTEP
jgi:NAD(P)-dependent dehydrogenase (short-subunit alcohol dehydrogenase family)